MTRGRDAEWERRGSKIKALWVGQWMTSELQLESTV